MSEPLELTQKLLEDSKVKEQFATLTQQQQEFIRVRFPACETNAQAIAILKAQGRALTARSVTRWQHDDKVFNEVYNVLKQGVLDIVKHVVSKDIAELAALAVKEARVLLATPWSDVEHSTALVNAKQKLIERFTPNSQTQSTEQSKRSISVANIAKIQE